VKRIAAPPSTRAASRPRPQLEIRDLELVLSLAEAGTTAGAAAALHITQSAISRALAHAEDRLGCRLFERTARGVTPTAAGERLIAGAGLVLSELSELEQRAAAPATPPRRARIVCECYTAYRWLPSALADLRRRLSGVELDLAVEHTQDPVGALVRGDIDIALLTTATLPRAGGASRAGVPLLDRPLFSDEVIFVVAATHPLAKKGSITRDDLRAHPLITGNTQAAEMRWFVASVFGRQKPKLEYMRLPLTEAIIDATRAGMGIAALSEWMASGYLGGGDLVVKRLRSGPLRRPWRIAFRRDTAELAERLASALGGSVPRLYAARAG
jgi:LysR family transcriptional regulator for metE and metH